MIRIIKGNSSCKNIGNREYSLYVNETFKVDFSHVREPEDLAQLLRDAADAIDLSNDITPPHLKTPAKRKLSMMERMNGIAHHLEKQKLDY